MVHTIKKENFKSIKDRLSILYKYKNRKWNKELQTSIRKDLENKNLFLPKAEGQNEDDKNAIVRVSLCIRFSMG